jgi:putative Mg2+ transporter-C (MgtC) family protein
MIPVVGEGRMDEVLSAVAGEFSDLSPVAAVQLAVRLLIAGVLGGVLGWERSQAGKAAGMRTHILVAVGSAAFIAVPQQAGVNADGISRVLQGLIAGIGFLGAGCIIRREDDGQVKGLTTAAGIWLTAAVGMAAGIGRETTAVLSALLALGILSLEGPIHRLMDKPGSRVVTGDEPRPPP